MKSIPTINPAITENIECSIVKVHFQLSIKIVGASPDHSVSLCSVSSFFEHFEEHSKQRITLEAPLLALL